MPTMRRRAPALLRQAVGVVASMTADGAYDSHPVYELPQSVDDSPPDVVIPPRATAVPSTDDLRLPTTRDRHVQLIAEKGRTGRQRATGYDRRNQVETARGRYKHLIGAELRARTLRCLARRDCDRHRSAQEDDPRRPTGLRSSALIGTRIQSSVALTRSVHQRRPPR